MLLGNNDEPPRDRTSWRKAPHSIREGVMGQPPLFLWYKLGKTRMQMTDSDLNNIITEIDVINGDGPPFWGFEKISTPLSKGRNGQTEDVYMTYRKGVKRNYNLVFFSINSIQTTYRPSSCTSVTFQPPRPFQDHANSRLTFQCLAWTM